MSDKKRRYDMLAKALEIENDGDLVAEIIENVGNVKVEDIDDRDGEFEVFMQPSGFTHKELMNLQELFHIKEIGVYGDPEYPEDTVYFHMIVYVND